MDLLKGESKDFGFDKNIPPLLKTFQQFKEIYYIYKYIQQTLALVALVNTFSGNTTIELANFTSRYRQQLDAGRSHFDQAKQT